MSLFYFGVGLHVSTASNEVIFTTSSRTVSALSVDHPHIAATFVFQCYKVSWHQIPPVGRGARKRVRFMRDDNMVP